MPRETRTAKVEARVAPSLRDALAAAAQAQDRSLAWAIEQAVTAWVAAQSRDKASKGDVR
jgi:predicted HicB family RNase H-like nuclease